MIVPTLGYEMAATCSGDKNPMPLVSVITATKNSERYLEQSLLSVANQTYANIEHLVFDGASSDRTVELIQRHAKHIDVWRSEPDNSMYEAINKAIEHAKGDIIAILNSDDRYANNNVISRIVSALSHSNVDGIYGDLIIERGNRRWYRKVFQVTFEEYLMAGKGTFVPHITLFLRRRCLDAIGLYSEKYRYAADYEFTLRCLRRCNVRYLPMPIAILRRHAGSITASGRIRQERDDVLRVLGLHTYPPLRRRSMRTLLWLKYYILNMGVRLFGSGYYGR